MNHTHILFVQNERTLVDIVACEQCPGRLLDVSFFREVTSYQPSSRASTFGLLGHFIDILVALAFLHVLLRGTFPSHFIQGMARVVRESLNLLTRFLLDPGRRLFTLLAASGGISCFTLYFLDLTSRLLIFFLRWFRWDNFDCGLAQSFFAFACWLAFVAKLIILSVRRTTRYIGL